MWTFSWWQILCLLALYCHVCHSQDENYCLPTYNAFGCRTCFRVFSAQSDLRNFEGSHQFCEAQGTDGRLLTFNNTQQISLLSTYLTLNSINEKLWIGMRYIDRNNEAVLVDINGDEVKLDITFEEGTRQAVGLCVSIMSRGDSAVSFLREECDDISSFICTMSSIELEITGFTSIPDGYGIRNDQMTFSCQFSPALDTQNIVTEWYHDGELVTTTGANENYIISSFQSSHSGNYSCSVLVMVGNVVLGGARSVEKSVKLAVAPTLSRPPQSATFYTHRIAYLECGIDSETFPQPNVTWLKDSVPVEFSCRNFFSPNTKSLIIRDIATTDSGRYTCEVSNVVETIRHSADLTVLSSQANETTILLHPMSVTAEVGSNVTFDCVGQDTGESSTVVYRWNVVGSITQRFEPLNFSSLDIANVQFISNISHLWCSFGNDASGGSILGSANANLILVESVRITGRSSNTNFLLGGTAQLSCEFKGTPSPQVQWYFKGRPVSDQHVITTNPSGGIVRGTTTLMISNFQFKDIGLYQCALSNYLQSVHQEFNLCGEADVPDVVTNVEVKSISQTQVKVYWNQPANVNSDPSLLQYRVHWDRVSEGTVLTVDNARNSSPLIPLIEDGYVISGLDPADQMAVLVVAVSYVGEKRDGVEVAKGQTFGTVPKELPVPLLNRTNNGKDIDVVWNPISPNRTAGEGYVHRYDIRYYQYEDVDNSIIVSVDNVTQYKILDVDEDTEYTVQVRVVVLKSTEPMQTFEFGEWGGILVPKPVVSSGDSDDGDSDTTIIIAIVIIIVCLLLIALLIGCMLWYGYRRIQRGRYYPAKTERQKGTLRISQNQNIYNNDSTIMTVDNSGLHHPSSTNGKCEV